MLDGIGEDISLALAVFLGVLLCTKYYGFAAVESVDPVNDLIEAFHLLELFCIDIEEVLLDRRIRTNTHDDDSGFLVLVALPIDSLQYFVSRLDYGNRRTAWRD